MSRRGGSSSAHGMQLLPFLDILTCTMGALVTLLFAFARYGQQQVVQVSDAKQAAAEAAAAAEVEDLQWRSSMLRDARVKTEGDLADARLELSHLEDHLRRLRERAQQMHQAAIALENADPKASDAKAKAELTQIKEKIALSKRELEIAKQNAANKPTTYSIVPYAGPNQTRRRPIYLECRAEGIVLEPEGIVFTDADFAGPLGPGNPLAAAVRAAREYMAAADPNAFEQVEPYPLLVVRPDAIPQYYAARSALISFGSQFGYELIGADKQLKFPDPDPRMADMIKTVVAEARIRQAQLIAAAPKHYRKPKTYHVKPGGGGIEAEPDSRLAQNDRNPYRGLNGRGAGGGRGTWGNGKGNGTNGGMSNGGNGTSTGTTTGTTVGTTTGTANGNGNGNGGLYSGGGGGGMGPGGAGNGGTGNGGIGNGGIGPGGADPLGTGNISGGGTLPGGGDGVGSGAAGTGGYGAGGGLNGLGLSGGAPGGYPPGGSPGGNGPGGMTGGAAGNGYGMGPPGNPGGPGTPGGVPGANLSALASNGGAAGGGGGAASGSPNGTGGPNGSQTGAAGDDDTPGGNGQGETEGSGGDGITGNSIGAPGQVSAGGGGSSAGRLAMGGQTQPGSNDAPGGTVPGGGTPQTTTLQGTGGAAAGNANGTGSGTGPGGGGLGGAGGKALGNAADNMPNGPQQRPSNGGAAVPNTRAQQATNANAWNLGGGADDTGPSNSNDGNSNNNSTSGGSSPSSGKANRGNSGSSGSTSSQASQSGQSGQNNGGQSGGDTPPSGQQSPIGMPNLNFGQKPQDPTQGKHGKKLGSQQRPPGWGLPDAPDTSASVSRPVVIECWPDNLAIISDDAKTVVKQIPLNQHTEDSVDELVSSVLQFTKQWGAAGKGLHWKPSLTLRVAPNARGRFEELQALLADSGLEVKESIHKPSIAGKLANPLRK